MRWRRWTRGASACVVAPRVSEVSPWRMVVTRTQARRRIVGLSAVAYGERLGHLTDSPAQASVRALRRAHSLWRTGQP